MSLPSGPSSLDARLRTMRILTIAIINGAVIFLAIALVLQLQGNMGPPRDPPIISYLALAMAVVDLVAYWIVPDSIATSARRQIARGIWTPNPRRPDAVEQITDEEPFWTVYQTRLIVSLALLEGATFFLLIGYLREGSIPTVIAAVVFIVGMLMLFPTRAGVDRWVDEQHQLLQEERQQGG